MNVEIKTEVTETKAIYNDNAHVSLVNGKITGIKVHRTSVVGALEFAHFGEFEQFVQNLVDVYHSVRLEEINEQERRAEQGTDRVPSEASL